MMMTFQFGTKVVLLGKKDSIYHLCRPIYRAKIKTNPLVFNNPISSQPNHVKYMVFYGFLISNLMTAIRANFIIF
jgi:hypothetical protein